MKKKINWYAKNVTFERESIVGGLRHPYVTATLMGSIPFDERLSTIEAHNELLKILSGNASNGICEIEKVVFNEPATIILWKDGTKTIVKCQEGDTYDPEKGMAMAICKKALGNKGNYANVFKKWLPEPSYEMEFDMSGDPAKTFEKAMKQLREVIK